MTTSTRETHEAQLKVLTEGVNDLREVSKAHSSSLQSIETGNAVLATGFVEHSKDIDDIRTEHAKDMADLRASVENIRITLAAKEGRDREWHEMFESSRRRPDGDVIVMTEATSIANASVGGATSGLLETRVRSAPVPALSMSPGQPRVMGDTDKGNLSAKRLAHLLGNYQTVT